MTRSLIARATRGSIAIFLAMAAAPLLITAAQARAPKDAFLRGAHFSPDTASVDVYLTAFGGGTSTLWLSDVGYGDVSPYRQIPAGTYAVSMRPHGAPASQKPVLTWTLDLEPGDAYTAAAIGMSLQLRGVVLSDTLAAPPRGDGLVRVIQASSQAGHVSIKAKNGPTLTPDAAFGTITKYVAVPAGAWTLQVDSSTHSALSTTQALSVRSQSVTTVVLLDTRSGGLAVHTLIDAAGAPTAPQGAVPAGGGGTAPRAPSEVDGLVSWVAFAAAALVLLVGVGIGRRSRRALPGR